MSRCKGDLGHGVFHPHPVHSRSDYPIEDSIWAKFKRTFPLDLLQT